MRLDLRRLLAGLCALTLAITILPGAAAANAAEGTDSFGENVMVGADSEYDLPLNGQVTGKCTVVVTVSDKDTSVGLSGAEVHIQEIDSVTREAVGEAGVFTSGSNGEVTITGMNTGACYRYEVSKAGYENSQKEEIPQGATGEAEGEPKFRISIALTKLPSGNGGNVSIRPIPPQTSKPVVSPSPPATDGPADTAQPTTPEASHTPETSTGPDTSRNPEPSEPRPSGGVLAQADNEVPTSTKPSEPQNIVLKVPAGERSIAVTVQEMEASRNASAEIHVIFPDNGTGQAQEVVLPPFTQHDLDLLGKRQVMVTSTLAGKYRLDLTVPKEDTPSSRVGLSHNLVQMVENLDAEVALNFEDDPTGMLLLQSAQVRDLVGHERDLMAEYDRNTEKRYLRLDVQPSLHEGIADTEVSAQSFQTAADNALGLKCCIYNPENDADLWYEWTFEARDVPARVETGMDINIYTTPDQADPILAMTDGIRVQYLITAHEGPLTALATLRVKNMTEVPATERLALVWANGEKPELVHSNLATDTEGFVQWEMEHCSSYALLSETAVESVLSGDSGLSIQVWLLLLIVLAIVFILIFIIWKWADGKRQRRTRQRAGGHE